MKKRFTIATIVLLSALVIFLFAVLIAGLFNGGKRVGVLNVSKNVVFEKDYKESEVDEIEIFIACGDVRFRQTDASKINLKISSDRKENLSVDLSNKKLNIDLPIKNVKINFFGFGRNRTKDDIVVSVPKNFGGKISITSNLGDISADDMKNGSVDIEADLGDVKLGKIKDAKIISHLGDVKIDEVLNLLNIESNMGDVRIESVKLNKDSKITSALGDVRIENAKGVYIDANVTLGNKRIMDNDRNANVTLYIESALGDVVVN